MDERTGVFRGNIFGGFNREDVVAYIRKISSELEECKKERDTLADQLDGVRDELDALKDREQALSDENTALKAQVEQLEAEKNDADELRSQLESVSDSAQAYEATKVRLAELEVSAVRRAAEIEKNAYTAAERTLEKTDMLLGSLSGDYDTVRAEVEASIENLCSELDSIREKLSAMSAELENSGETLSSFVEKSGSAAERLAQE